jgi:hypothetical protein
MGILGLAFGFFLNAALINFWGGATSRWELFQSYPFSFYINNTVAALPILFFSALGVGWLVVLRPQWRKLAATKALIALGLLLPVAFSLTALDQTRISSLVLFASFFLYICESTSSLNEAEMSKTWRALMLGAIVVPIPLYLAGVVDQTGWQSILYWTANFL